MDDLMMVGSDVAEAASTSDPAVGRRLVYEGFFVGEGDESHEANGTSERTHDYLVSVVLEGEPTDHPVGLSDLADHWDPIRFKAIGLLKRMNSTSRGVRAVSVKISGRRLVFQFVPED
jgi:hypothetical protein